MKKSLVLILTISLILSLLAGCVPETPTSSPSATDTFESLETPSTSTTLPMEPDDTVIDSEDSMTVHVIDVGQGHSVLIESDNEYMLVDTGESEYANTVISYLQSQGVTELKYAIATHPHSDHMGGYNKVIDGYPINLFLMPNAQNNTATFERMLTALTDKNTPVSIPKVGNTYELGDATVTILSPSSSSYDDLNDCSIGVRVECGNMSFIVTGDATTVSEAEILNTGLELDSDVMLVPHHGSTSSSSLAFIKAVSPSMAIISCGKDNSYGHPHNEITTRYSSLNIPLYRTDECGTIVVEFTTTGYKVVSGTSSTQTPPAPEQNNNETQYIGNVNSKKFHSPDCPNLPAEHNRVYFTTRDDAVAAGYDPCGNCKP